MPKVLITTEVWETYEYGYGTYQRKGTPSIGMVVADFDTKEDAEAAIIAVQEANRKTGVSTMITALLLVS